jgi:Txe/YoeB family toxin of Txe-Axe toxin-antitoxin module
MSLKKFTLEKTSRTMYDVIVPYKVILEITAELDFWSQKNESFAEKVAIELEFHLTQTLKYNPGFGALKAKKADLLYYLIQKQFKLVFEIDEDNKQVIIHYFFNARKAISEYV